jgi:hypothetical protein
VSTNPLNPRMRLRTSDAAKFLTSHGRKCSPSLLRQWRMRAVADLGERGPAWEREPNGNCVYSIEALDAYLAAYLQGLRPMQPAEQSPHLQDAAKARAAA